MASSWRMTGSVSGLSSFSRCDSSGTCGEREKSWSRTWWLQGYSPVSTVIIEGVVHGAAAVAERKITPSCASLRMRGPVGSGEPTPSVQSARRESMEIKSRFGRSLPPKPLEHPVSAREAVETTAREKKRTRPGYPPCPAARRWPPGRSAGGRN